MKKQELKQKAQQLSLWPGVYFMEDSLGNIIYIGKSKALKNRVSSYFSGSKKPPKVERMMRSINDFKIQYTDTELEALILECQLIKAHRPIYNRLLKQDHKYRYLYLNPTEQRPRIKLVREQTEEGHYFGPYEKGQFLYQTVQVINEYYELPDCKWQEIKENCLTHKRGKCIGPCKMPYDEVRFKEKLEMVKSFFEGEDNSIINCYERQMEEAANSLDFEEALACKEIWQGLRALQFKKEAMAFALSSTISVLVEECPSGGNKLFLWLGTNLLWSRKIKDKLRGKSKEKIIENVLDVYEKNSLEVRKNLLKEEIDEAQIIYSWFNKKTPECYGSFCLKSKEEDKGKLREIMERVLS